MSFLKSAVPGSLPFLLVSAMLGVGLLYWSRAARWGRRCLFTLFLCYTALSLPVGSAAIARLLAGGFQPLASRDAARGATAIVVLDGGTLRYTGDGAAVQIMNRTSALRTIEAVRVFKLIEPALVIVAGGSDDVGSGLMPGGQAIRDELVHAGVPVDRLLLDSSSHNTREHALTLTRILREHGVRRFVLVTSPTHIRRAMLAFRAAGSDPVPSISALWGDPDLGGWGQFWPSPVALQVSEDGAHDALGLVYYWSRGWL